MEPSTPRSGRALVLPSLLVVATLAVYANSLGGGFVWDDVPIVVEGTIARGGRAFGSALLEPDVVKPYYRPVTRASFHVDALAWGDSPVGFHAVNVALHLANVLALFFLARLMFGRRWLAFTAALLLAVHPVNAETVDFVSARNNLLALFFLLGSLGLAVRATRSGSSLAAWGSGACLFLALGSKESAAAGIVFIATAILWPVRPEGHPAPRQMAMMIPHALFLACYVLLRRLALGGVGAGLGLQAPMEVARINFHVIPQYLGLALYPVGLNVFHAVPPGWGAGSPWLPLAWVAIALATVALIVQRSPPSLLGLAWLTVNFLPVANLVPIPSAAMAERFIYLPAVGLWVIAADQGTQLVGRVSWKKTAVALQAALAVALAATTFRRNAAWHDDLSLFQSSVNEDPRSSLGLFNLGTTLRDTGDLTGARRAWERAIEVDPRDVGALVQLGTLSAVQGDLPGAEGLYRRALDVDPRHAMANLNMAKLCERTGRAKEAAAFYGRFLDVATPGEVEYVPAARSSRERILRSAGRAP